MMGIFGKKKNDTEPSIRLFNTLSGKLEAFEPGKKREVRMYHCGPTVYDFQHIGNFRPYVFADVLRRMFEYQGFRVKQVINITDVGHLTGENAGNADAGDDKMAAALAKSGEPITLENMHALGERYTKVFFDGLDSLGTKKPMAFPRASDHIGEQIALLQTLEEKGYVYTTSDGIYFDTARFDDYGKLGNIDIAAQQEGLRLAPNKEKRNPADFALWKFSDDIGWESPWGRGFPGWHLECSAMASKYLGKSFDIHTGGTDHIPVHHNNEIAQSEAATGKPLARYWMHHALITIEGRKISKSIGNTIYLRNIIDRGYSPLSYRYWLLTAHYRSMMNFTWEALDASHTALRRLHRFLIEDTGSGKNGTVLPSYKERFLSAIDNDLDTPAALALVWKLVKDETVDRQDKRATLLDFDTVLGLGLHEADKRKHSLLGGAETRLPVHDAPDDVQKLVEAREQARKQHDYEKADKIRDELAGYGYHIDDTDEGPVLTALQDQV